MPPGAPPSWQPLVPLAYGEGLGVRFPGAPRIAVNVINRLGDEALKVDKV